MRSKKKGFMKRFVALLLGAVVMLTTFPLIQTQAAVDTSEAPSRVINLVYDDSGSMIRVAGTHEPLDTWCQAKYAMEVFAGLLGEKDTMNVYVMSDFDEKEAKSSTPKLILRGSEGAKANVKKVHDMVTHAGDTPIQSVIQAYNDLTKATADEKWLVVLTDGVFEPEEEVKEKIGDLDSYFAKKESDINVMFLGMGADADEITPNEGNNIYSEKAQTSKEILTKITEICTRIFNRNRLEVDVSAKTINFDVPMSELIIFAQGANVQIDGIQPKDGNLIKSSKEPVTVMYSTTATTNPNYEGAGLVDKELVGSIATFKDDFVAGDYTLQVSGAETIEVYYTPNVAVKAYLKDLNGNDIPEDANLMEGEYIVEYGLVKAGTNEPVPESKLLGEVTYEATVTNNGVTHEKIYASGDKVSLVEGTLTIDVTARYLEYNKVYTTLDYDTVYKNKLITYSLLEDPTYTVTEDGLEATEPIVMKAKLDGNEFTQEQWDLMGVPNVEFTSTPKFDMGAFRVEKQEEVGIYHLYPTLAGDNPEGEEYKNCDYAVSYSMEVDKETWSGAEDFTLKLNDTRPWWIKHWGLFVRLFWLALLLFLILGYIPGIKPYLPKRLKKRPYVTATPNIPGEDIIENRGTLSKNILTTIIPYIAETGTLKFVPSGVYNVPVMQIKGKRIDKMTITNTKAYAGKEHITFNGSSVAEGTKKPIVATAGILICVEDPNWTYTCQPNI